MRSELVIDIETVKDDSMPEALLQSLYDNLEVKADGRIKDPDKIQADIDDKLIRAKLTLESEFALSPMTGKVCCVGYQWLMSDEHNSYQKPEAFSSKNEVEILQEIQSLFLDTDQLTIFITFNGKSFDFPFLKIRCAINGIPVKFPKRDTKYDLDTHFDVRSALTNFEQYGKGKLPQWAMRFGIPVTNLHTGSTIQDHYDKDELNTISDICKGDVELTSTIYSKIKDYWR